MPNDVLRPKEDIKGKGDTAKDDNLFTPSGNKEHSDSNIVSIEFQPSQPEENIERPVSCQSQSRSQSQAYWGMKQHIVSFRTRLVQSRSEITTLYHKDKAQDSLLGTFLAFRCVFIV